MVYITRSNNPQHFVLVFNIFHILRLHCHAWDCNEVKTGK